MHHIPNLATREIVLAAIYPALSGVHAYSLRLTRCPGGRPGGGRRSAGFFLAILSRAGVLPFGVPQFVMSRIHHHEEHADARRDCHERCNDPERLVVWQEDIPDAG